MVLRHVRPEGERHLRGEGPRRIRVAGGQSTWPSYEGAAYYYSVALPLTSVPRLRVMCLLCEMPWSRGPAMAKRLGLHVNSVSGALHGMRDMGLVENRPAPIGWPYSRSRTGGVYALDWRPTDVGRVMFWRFGRVTAQLIPGLWRERGFFGSEDLSPLDALTRYAEPSLARPMTMALAFRIMFGPYSTEVELARGMEVRREAIAYALRRWRSMGWLEEAPRFYALDRVHPGTIHAPSWKFTRDALIRIEQHASAVWWAAQTCGYEGDPEDEDAEIVGVAMAYAPGPDGP